MTVDDVSTKYDIPVPTIYRLIREHRIPYEDRRRPYATRAAIRFDPVAVEAWYADLLARKQGSAA